MIEVEGLRKRFGAKVAVDGVSFTAARGEVLGFLGPNGAGKTTTMRILAGLTPSSEGVARVAGFDTARDGLAARRHVGYLPERVPLYDEMRVGAFLRFVGEMKGLGGAPLARAAERAAEDTGIEDVLREVIGRLSRGYRQRVGLAQALLADPPVLLLDEPTAGLDPAQIAEVRALIRRLGGERTVLLSTHILPEVSATCGRVVILARGRVVAIDTPHRLTARIGSAGGVEVAVAGEGRAVPEIARRIAGVLETRSLGPGRFLVVADERAGENAGAGAGAAPGGIPASDVIGALAPRLARALIEAGEDLLELRTAERSLEEVFLDLVMAERSETAERTAIAERSETP